MDDWGKSADGLSAKIKQQESIIEAEKKKLEGEIKRVEGKLNNPGFMAKAPEKLVTEEREKGEKYKAMLDKVLESIKAINEM